MADQKSPDPAHAGMSDDETKYGKVFVQTESDKEPVLPEGVDYLCHLEIYMDGSVQKQRKHWVPRANWAAYETDKGF